MNDTLPETYRMSGYSLSSTDLARSWFAFKELRRLGIIGVEFSVRATDVNQADAAGWDLGFGARERERRYLARMEADPYDYHRGYEWGIDFMDKRTLGHVLSPSDLDAVVRRERETSGGSAEYVSDAEVQRWAEHLRKRALEVSAPAPVSPAPPTPAIQAAASMHRRGSVLGGLGWMILMGCLLFWLPVFGPFLAGLVGGKKSGGIGKALAAALLPAMMVGVIAAAAVGSLSGIPVLAIVAGLGTAALAAASVGALLLGAIIGGLIA